MANMQKYHAGDMATILRHNFREVASGNYSNPDIKNERRKLNMSLSPDFGRVAGKRHKAALKRYEERRQEVGGSKRKDLVTAAEWIISLPKEIWDMSEAMNGGEPFPTGSTLREVEAFFKATEDFLEERYGPENVLAAEVHFDEGRMIPLQETNWDGTPRFEKTASGKSVPVWKRDEKGNIIVVQGYGQPHLHFDFMPIVNGKDGSERFCAKQLLDRRELSIFHHDLNDYLKAHGVKGAVLNGSTRDHSFTVEQLKAGIKEEYERFRREHEQSHAQQHNW